jgi:hypothetical protein
VPRSRGGIERIPPASRAARVVSRTSRGPDSPGPRQGRPEPRPVERSERGRIVAMPMVGGLHHRYSRRVAVSPSGRLCRRRWRARSGHSLPGQAPRFLSPPAGSHPMGREHSRPEPLSASDAR